MCLIKETEHENEHSEIPCKDTKYDYIDGIATRGADRRLWKR